MAAGILRDETALLDLLADGVVDVLHRRAGLEHFHAHAVGLIERVVDLQHLVGSRAADGERAGNVAPVAEVGVADVKLDNIAGLEDVSARHAAQAVVRADRRDKAMRASTGAVLQIELAGFVGEHRIELPCRHTRLDLRGHRAPCLIRLGSSQTKHIDLPLALDDAAVSCNGGAVHDHALRQ